MITKLVDHYRRWKEMQSALRQLERLDDHSLRDIGLTRGSIRSTLQASYKA